MLQPRTFGVVAGLLLLCSCATVKLARSRLPADVTLNKNAGRGGWLVVTLRLESGERLPFLLDTGSPWTLFDESQEPRLGNRLGTETLWNFGTKYESGMYAAPKLFLGSTRLMMNDTVIGTSYCKQLSTKAGRPIMGVLGMDCLEHYCIQLDFAAGKMRFLDDEPANKKGWGKPFPLTDLGNGCFSVSENLAGAKGPGSLIDTGALCDGWLMPDLFQQWTNRAKLPTGGEVRSPTGVLGGETYPVVYLDRLDEKSLLRDESNIQYNGIGLGFLARHLVTLDFPKRTLYLKRTRPLPLLDKDVEPWARAAGKSAWRFLDRLKEQGQLPGWSKKDKYAAKAWTLQVHDRNCRSRRSSAEKGRSIDLSLRTYPSVQSQSVEAAESMAGGSERVHG